MPWPGGVGVDHSSELACHGLSLVTRFPFQMFQSRLNRKMNWEKPSRIAYYVMKTFMDS